MLSLDMGDLIQTLKQSIIEYITNMLYSKRLNPTNYRLLHAIEAAKLTRNLRAINVPNEGNLYFLSDVLHYHCHGINHSTIGRRNRSSASMNDPPLL